MQIIQRVSRRMLRALSRPKIPNLVGDRDIEWSWMASRLPQGPGEALDFGNGGSPLSLMASLRGFHVTAIDLGNVDWPYIGPKLKFMRCDILSHRFSEDSFDLILNCSTVEHVGLVGRYGVTANLRDGDLQAMERLRTILKPAGLMLLTIPVGQDAVFAPLCRVYGQLRLPQLLNGFKIEDAVYWIKNSGNKWVIGSQAEALAFPASAGSWDPMRNSYALGCFVLRRST